MRMLNGPAVVAGLLWGGEVPVDSVGGAWIGAVAVFALSGCRRRLKPLAIGVALFLLGVGWATVQQAPTRYLGPTVGTCTVEGTVARSPLNSRGGCTLALRSARVDGHGLGDGLLSVYLGTPSCPDLAMGVSVVVRGRLRRGGAYRNPHPGLSRPRRWYVVASEVELVQAGSTPGALDRLRGWVDGALRFDDARTSALYRALLLGDRRAVTPSMRDPFIDTGTAHLLAISGLHLAVVGWLFFRVIMWLLLWWPPLAQAGRPRAWSAGLTLAWVFTYLAIIEPTDATLRASIGMAFVLVGILLSRRMTPGHLLRLAALAILLVDPRAAWGPSFQLSFAAATSIVLVWPHVRRLQRWLVTSAALSRRWIVLAHVLVGAWAVSGATAAVTMPLGLAWFGQQALMGAPISVVAVPWVGCVVLPLGLLAWLTTACCPFLAAWVSPAAEGALGVLVDGLEGWAQVLGTSHAAAWPWAAGLTGALTVLLALHRPGRWRILLLFASMTAIQVAASQAPEGTLRVSFLDVGHGDSTLLQLPGGHTVLVDTGGHRRGPDRASDRVAEQALIPALRALGVARLDLLVITHPDTDHMGAAYRLAERMPIGTLWVSPCGATTPSMAPLIQRIRAQDGEVVRVSRSGPLEWSGARLTVLWPPAGVVAPDGGCLRSSNDGGLVITVAHAGRKVLLTADIGREVERLLVRRVGSDLRADVLKVPHHGSHSSSSQAFLATASPSVVVLSAGRPGGTGRRVKMPPHAEVLRRYRALGVPLWFTGRDGAVQVEIDGEGRLRSGPMGWR